MFVHGMMRPMDTEAGLVARWRSLLSCYNTIACDLDRRLQERHRLSMSDFEALDRLIDAGCDKCRMQQLAADMYLSQSALSRTVARLEKHGLVVREMCVDDRRGVFVRVTDEGRRLHTDARKTHLEVLAEHLDPTTT